MSYRHRFACAEKQYVDEFLKMNSAEAIAFTKEHNPSAYDEIDDVAWLNCWNIFRQEEIFNFGHCPVWQTVLEHSTAVFDDGDEIGKYFVENNMRLCTKETLLAAIEGLRGEIARHFNELKNDADAALTYCHRRAEEWMLFTEAFADLHIESGNKLNRIHFPYNLDEDRPVIVQSGLYEYAIFELVRIYKTFDWENNYLLFYGW